ncbi:MAG: TolC family protein [Endomicrobium sp.]|jgi:outer membrane protein TolC|nr:TolC family protein [Endomicrobium sp.]
MKILKLSFVIAFVFITLPVFSEVLSVKDYMDMVNKNNKELKSVNLGIDSVKEKLLETEKNHSYFFYVSTDYTDGRNSSESGFDEITTCNANIGRFFKTGTYVSLGLKYKYDMNFGKNLNNRSNFLNPFLSLEQSLWKDINGVFTKTVIAKEQAHKRSKLYSLEYDREKILLKAKFAYWDLAYLKSRVYFEKLSLERAKKILDWNQKKYRMNLIEELDLLQAQATVKIRELSLSRAYEEEKRARRVFNQFLNIEEENVNYELEKIENKSDSFKDKPFIEKKRVRADVLSLIENVRIASYDQIISKKNLGADLVLKGSFCYDDDIRRKKTTYRPNYSLSLKYTLPFDFKLRRSINKGYELAKLSAQKSAEYAVTRENNEWLQILEDWNSAKMRLKLVSEIKEIEMQKYHEYKNLLIKGRSTTFYVLESERKLNDAVLQVLKTIWDIIKIYEEAKMFYGDNYI